MPDSRDSWRWVMRISWHESGAIICISPVKLKATLPGSAGYGDSPLRRGYQRKQAAQRFTSCDP
jgi:hypothetical protein